MKFLSLLTGCSLLGLSSCALSSDKPKKDESGGSAIPPPANLQASNTSSNIPEELPELPSSSEQGDSPTEKVNVKEIDGFRFKNVLDDLPSQRELASPPTSFTPSPDKDEKTQSIEDPSKPLVINP